MLAVPFHYDQVLAFGDLLLLQWNNTILHVNNKVHQRNAMISLVIYPQIHLFAKDMCIQNHINASYNLF